VLLGLFCARGNGRQLKCYLCKRLTYEKGRFVGGGVASRHADQHEQPGVGVRESKAAKGGGRAGGTSNGDEKRVLREAHLDTPS